MNWGTSHTGTQRCCTHLSKRYATRMDGARFTRCRTQPTESYTLFGDERTTGCTIGQFAVALRNEIRSVVAPYHGSLVTHCGSRPPCPHDQASTDSSKRTP